MKHKNFLDARYHDLLEDQSDPTLLDLIQDLDMLYTANQVPERLASLSEGSYGRTASPHEVPAAQFGTFSVLTRPARRWSRLTSLAAVLFTLLLVSMLLGAYYVLRGGIATSPAQKKTSGTPPVASTSLVVLGPRACPQEIARPAHWESIVKRYTYGGPYHVEMVSCANIVGNSSLQALVTVRREDDSDTLDVFVFTAITAVQPVRVFQSMGLVKGSAKISGYNTVLTAQVEERSALNAGQALSAMTADLFREFKWSPNAKTLLQTVFPGMFPDMTRYQAEDDQYQVTQGHQPWKVSATGVATALTVSLLNWSINSTATVSSGGGFHDVNAVVSVRSTQQVAGMITVTLSRLEGNTNRGIWEVIAVAGPGVSISAPASRTQISSPVQTMGTGTAFEGVIGQLQVLDHAYTELGHASAIGANGMGQTSFSTSVDYQSTFPAGVQEGILALLVPSNANGSIATAFMEKVLIKSQA